jgi:hypothetical protein
MITKLSPGFFSFYSTIIIFALILLLIVATNFCPQYDRQHLELINGYFQYAGGFEPRKAFDITATLPDNGYRDPMFIIEAVKETKTA